MERSLADFLCPELLRFCQDDDVFDLYFRTTQLVTAIVFQQQ